MTKKELLRLVTEAVEPELVSRGFRRKRKSPPEYVRELAKGVTGHLEWTDSFRDGVLELSPMLGVRHADIEKELGRLGFFSDALSAWKAAGYLGEPGHYQVERVTGPEDVPAAVAGLLRQVDTASLYDRCATYVGLLDFLDEQGYGNAMARARRALILRRLGREQEARDYLRAELDTVSGMDGVALSRFLEEFASAR